MWIRIRIRNIGFNKIFIQLGGDPLKLVDSQLFMTTVSDEGPSFFLMALGLNDFDAGKSITRATEGGGP
jgi:hypothetical protein